ncbi:serine protease [Paenibacillus sp. JX-17]|uniref:Serine protease n=1 Tax=Paenibacillus lacisoli TaxID=3064525 RepID=A0ABT9CDV8_9BACL|nr:serine protease [Paenibacillus sp. JX-17]MDO7906819.1 serine protease [Paenibacillus sp. JX-17]
MIFSTKHKIQAIQGWKMFASVAILGLSLLLPVQGVQAQSLDSMYFSGGYYNSQLKGQLSQTADSILVVNVRWVSNSDPYTIHYDVGTSMLVSEDTVLTNYHVVKEYAELPAGSKGTLRVASPSNPLQAIDAQIIKADKNRDMALLKLSQKVSYTPITFSKARDNEPVYTIGYPENPMGQLTLLDRLTGDANFKLNTLSSTWVYDAQSKDVPGMDYVGSMQRAVKQGNSGGPVLDADMHVVGMMTFTYKGKTYFINAKTLQEFIGSTTTVKGTISASGSTNIITVPGRIVGKP